MAPLSRQLDPQSPRGSVAGLVDVVAVEVISDTTAEALAPIVEMVLGP